MRTAIFIENEITGYDGEYGFLVPKDMEDEDAIILVDEVMQKLKRENPDYEVDDMIEALTAKKFEPLNRIEANESWG